MSYETIDRRAEFLGFEFEDVTCQLNGKPALRLRFSKADQYGEGRLIGISKNLEELITKWRDIVGPKGKILRAIDRHGNIGEKLEPSAISYILRQVQANITHPDNKKDPPMNGVFVSSERCGRLNREQLADSADYAKRRLEERAGWPEVCDGGVNLPL